MGFGPGLARFACQCCQADQLMQVRQLMEAGRVRCVACGGEEALSSVEARDAQLATLLQIMRELDHCRNRAAAREAVMAAPRPVREKERL